MKVSKYNLIVVISRNVTSKFQAQKNQELNIFSKLVLKRDVILSCINLFFISLLALIFFSCNTGRNLSEKNNPKPDWVTSKPQSSTYYIGVSSAPKKGYLPSEYIQSAQQKALADMSASISVNIESTSVLSRIEDNYNLHENFSSEIIATTSQLLEDYELVDVWEDENYYWVYYRLSKTIYKTQKEKKKQQILLESKNKLKQADDLINKRSYYNAFQFYSDAFSVLKPYLGESTLTEIDGNTQDLGNYIFTKIAGFVNDINFKFPEDEVSVKKGVDIDADIFNVNVFYKNEYTMSNIPVKINFTGSGLLRNSETSDNNGKFFCSVKKVTSSPGMETLSVNVDMLSLSKVAKDPMIRNIIKSIPASENKLRVKVIKPVLKIISNEKSFETETSENKLKSTFQSMLSSEFSFTESTEYDFILNITSNTTKNGQKYGEPLVVINYTFDLTNTNGKNVFRKSSSNEYYASTYEVAVNKAYNEVSTSIERFIANELISSLRK
jgi:hypothetical protein